MYEVEDLLVELRSALRVNDFVALQHAVRNALREPPLSSEAGSSRLLHSEPGLTLLHAVVNPGFASPPHDHRTWAIIGVYDGQEDNTFYRRNAADRGIEEAGSRSFREGEVMMLGSRVIHRIANPRERKLVALHIYGDNIFEIERSAWDLATGMERRFDLKLDARGTVRT